MPFLQKKSFHLTFSSHRSTIYKVPPRIGGHHFLLCQQTNTKDIAGQSANIEYEDKFMISKRLQKNKHKLIPKCTKIRAVLLSVPFSEKTSKSQ